MIFTISILFLALAIAFAMIARRVWQLRTGRLVMDPSYEPADWTDLSIEGVRVKLVEWAKFVLHHAILLALKVWIKTSYTVKKWDRYVRSKLTHILHKNGHLPPGGKPSSFLKNIRAHKDQVASEMRKEKSEEVAEKE